MLTDAVGQNWWRISKKTVADETAARMGTIAAPTVVRIAQLAGQLPIIDIGFGYGQVVWQLQMIGANVIGGMEMESTYVDVAINMQRTIFSALAARCAVSFACDTMSPRWINPATACAYYMNNIALKPKENGALWNILKTAPVGSKIITTSVMMSVRNDANWQMVYDDAPLIARHSTSQGKIYSRGLVCYTRVQ